MKGGFFVSTLINIFLIEDDILQRKIFIALLALIMVVAFFVPAMAAQVFVDGDQLEVNTASENGTTMVPLRAIFQALGATVDWDGVTQTVTATKAQTEVKLQISSETAYKNGQEVTLQVPGKIISSNTMVPLRFVSEALGASVDWDGATQTITITSSGIAPTSTPKPVPRSVSESVPTQSTGEYVGSDKSDKYHYPDCRYAKNISPENLIWFKDATSAQSQGYVPCEVCKP